MSEPETKRTALPTCNDCGRTLAFWKYQEVGRPVYWCENCEDTQVGPNP